MKNAATILTLIGLTALSLSTAAQGYQYTNPFTVVHSDGGGFDYVDDGPTEPIETLYGQCNACFTPNPPWFCSDPQHECYQGATSVPIDGGIFLLMIAAGVLGVSALRGPRFHTYKQY